jgi:hypothetical protein
MVAEGDRLGALQMGETGHDRGGVRFGFLKQHGDERLERGGALPRLLLDPEPEIHSHLIVARAGGVQASSSRSDDFGEPRFDIHVNVLALAGKLEFAAFDLAQDFVKTGLDLLMVGFGNYALFCQHLRMSEGPGNVLCVEFAVKADGGVDFLHDGGRGGGETSAPHFIARLLV